jgi:transposase
MMRFVEDFIREEPSVEKVTRIGMDTSKRFFQLHGVDASEQVALRRQLTRAQVLPFFERPATVVAMEACGAAHHWARELMRLGHEVRLIAPQLAKPYVARGKNDAADAAALCEAASRPHMRFVPAKTIDQQTALMLVGQRERLVRQRTQLVNTIRGHEAEFGLVAAKGPAGIGPLLERLAGADIPTLARALFAGLAEEHAGLCTRIAALDRRLRDWHAKNEVARRLTAIPGVGRLIASLLVRRHCEERSDEAIHPRRFAEKEEHPSPREPCAPAGMRAWPSEGGWIASPPARNDGFPRHAIARCHRASKAAVVARGRRAPR